MKAAAGLLMRAILDDGCVANELTVLMDIYRSLPTACRLLFGHQQGQRILSHALQHSLLYCHLLDFACTIVATLVAALLIHVHQCHRTKALAQQQD